MKQSRSTKGLSILQKSEEKKMKQIKVERNGEQFEIPEEDLQAHLDGAEWLIQEDMKMGFSREESAKIYGIRIVKDEK